MPAFKAGKGEVRDFIAHKTRRLKFCRCGLHLVENLLVACHALKPALVLERVRGTVPRPPFAQNAEVRPRVAWIADYEIDSRILEPAADERKRPCRERGGVAAPHRLESAIVKRLNAHGDPVHSGVGEH